MRHIFKKIFKSLAKITPILPVRIALLRGAGYIIGKDVYLPSDLLISDLKSRRGNVIIGDRVSIGPKVILITDSSPNNSRLQSKFPLMSGSIIIEEDVWLGAGTIILPNVKVGKCSIVAAGSLCNKNIGPYTIVGGIPAKIIKLLDETEI